MKEKLGCWIFVFNRYVASAVIALGIELSVYDNLTIEQVIGYGFGYWVLSVGVLSFALSEDATSKKVRLRKENNEMMRVKIDELVTFFRRQPYGDASILEEAQKTHETNYGSSFRKQSQENCRSGGPVNMAVNIEQQKKKKEPLGDVIGFARFVNRMLTSGSRPSQKIEVVDGEVVDDDSRQLGSGHKQLSATVEEGRRKGIKWKLSDQ